MQHTAWTYAHTAAGLHVLCVNLLQGKAATKFTHCSAAAPFPSIGTAVTHTGMYTVMACTQHTVTPPHTHTSIVHATLVHRNLVPGKTLHSVDCHTHCLTEILQLRTVQGTVQRASCTYHIQVHSKLLPTLCDHALHTRHVETSFCSRCSGTCNTDTGQSSTHGEQ